MSNNISINGSVNVTHSSNVSIGNISSSKSSDLSEVLELAKLLSEDKSITQDQKMELDNAIHCIEGLNSNDQNSKKLFSESRRTIRSIAEGIAGSTLATALLTALSKLV